MCEIHSYLKVSSDSKIFREVSSLFLPESTPYFIEDVYHVLIVILRLPHGVKHCDVGSVDLDNKQYPMEPVYIRIERVKEITLFYYLLLN